MGFTYGSDPLKATIVRASGSPKRAAGRPRSEKTRRAILKTAFRLLKQDGFDGVSMQQIAVEAGVSTATLYRWWDSKQAILLDAYLETTRELLPYGKRGSPLARLQKYTLRIAEFLKSDDGRVFIRLLVAIQDNRNLGKAFYENVFLPRRAEGCAVVQEAVAAGELPDTVDPDFIINLLTAPQIVRALLGLELSAKSAQTIFDFVVKASLQ
ncbi:TetR/AcrR family transcriptional regulator [Silvibacterium bohemicum]|nr:TetR/AcrR family transcriptional regulator [Silvibacterium bohemicum]